MVSALEQGKVIAENERQARQVQQTQPVANNQVAWDHYVDSRIALYLNSRRAESNTYDLLPDALHDPSEVPLHGGAPRLADVRAVGSDRSTVERPAPR